jgi:predicted naringenin-chalcone synthase
LDARLDIVATAVPELAAQASKKAIAEWGRPATDITHLVVTTNSGAHIPGVDFRLIPLLGLRPSVRRTMLYLNGCFAGSAALRLAKDLAENNRGARVLVVCAELTLMLFSGPKEGCFQTLVNQGLFGDGAAAVIVGADPASTGHEHPLFEIVSAAQTVVPGSDHAINMHPINSRQRRKVLGSECAGAYNCYPDAHGRSAIETKGKLSMLRRREPACPGPIQATRLASRTLCCNGGSPSRRRTLPGHGPQSPQ